MVASKPYIMEHLEDGLVVARCDGYRLFMLNGSARFAWERRMDGFPDIEIPALIAAQYGISLAQAQHDFQAILRIWSDEGLSTLAGIYRYYQLAGLGFSIHFRNAELDDAIAPSLAHLETTSSNAFKPCLEFDLGVHSSEFVFRRDDVEVFRSSLLDEIIERLIIEITNFVYDEVEWIIFYACRGDWE